MIEVNGMNVLTAIFGEQDSQAVYFLNQENITRIDVVNYATQGIAKQPREQTEYFSEEDMQSETIIPRETSTEDSLVEMYTINLNEKATSGNIKKERLCNPCYLIT